MIVLAGTLLDFRMRFGQTIPADAKIIQLDMDAILIGQNRQADVALYCAKNAGGNRISVTDESEVREVFAQSALQQAHGVEIVGRRSQLERAADGLDRLTLRESSFLLHAIPPVRTCVLCRSMACSTKSS